MPVAGSAPVPVMMPALLINVSSESRISNEESGCNILDKPVNPASSDFRNILGNFLK
jgi:hypothetical protein